MRRSVAPILLIALLLPAAVTGQLPVVRAGVTAGAVKLSDIRAEQVLSAILEYDPTSWLSVSVLPSGVRVSQTLNGRSLSRSGLADLPVAVAASYTFPSGWSPDVGAGLTVTLPAGNAACGLGSGVTSLGASVGVGVAPIDPLHLSLDASRSLTGSVAQSALTAPHATWVSSAASVAVSSRWTALVSVGADLGHRDSTRVLSRELGAGVSYALAGPLTFTLDASHGLTGASPKWVLSLGVGTAFAGTSPIIPTAPVRRLQTTFVGGRPKTTTVAAGCS